MREIRCPFTGRASNAVSGDGNSNKDWWLIS